MVIQRQLSQIPRTTRLNIRKYQTASQKLFEEALKEEQEDDSLKARKQRIEQRLLQDENWTGEERIEDTVLRMLVDKHKPMRATMKTADEKLKAAPPKVSHSSLEETSHPEYPQVDDSDSEEHKPWLTTFVTPSFAVNPSIRYMRPLRQNAAEKLKMDETALVKGPTREEKARLDEAKRLMSARERVIDYRFGGPTRPGVSVQETGKSNPKTMKGWKSLVEERIENARARGAFSNLKGIGKPLNKDPYEANPFVPPTDLILNNLVKRNGASPPWIEFQQELESSVAAFRNILRDAWVRRAVRTLSLTHAHNLEYLHNLTPESLSTLRDKEWEEKESSYHEHAISELNSLVRKYNGMAPYSVRRGLHTREGELARVYSISGEHIFNELRAVTSSRQTHGKSDPEGRSSASSSPESSLWAQFVDAIRSLLRVA
ncbi:hypothetical protein FRC14_001361 [Serendipita sp. 396]|nr:hypothetical protein FRC14_001361 [Serendipita sp. 396]KAG8782501.1 hypothetical protein FRC15_006873 [Serendipita sp. 397]